MLSSLAQVEADPPYSNTPAVVITTGSFTTRAGFSSEEAPRSVFPTVVGTPLSQGIPGTNKLYCGREAISKRSELRLNYPIESGITTNWDMTVELFAHLFDNELKVASAEQTVMMSEVPIGPKANREKMTQIMFETFNVRALFMKIQMTLSLIASGRLTGLVVHTGSNVTRIVPIYLGYWLPHAILREYVGGNDVTSNLIEMLSKRGHSFSTPAEKEMVRRMKEKLAFVSEDFKRDMSHPSCAPEEEYRLPDGRVVKLGSEKFRCAELLFDPSQIGNSSAGIGSSTYSTLMKCDVDIRKDLLGNVLLSGGNSMLRGMDKRLERELKGYAPASLPVQILSPPARDISSWYGGAILSSHSSMHGQWVSRAEYDDSGPSIIHRKCH